MSDKNGTRTKEPIKLKAASHDCKRMHKYSGVQFSHYFGQGMVLLVSGGCLNNLRPFELLILNNDNCNQLTILNIM